MKTILTSLFLLALVQVQSATFTVTTTSDSGPGSLRQALSDANAAGADAMISFTASGTITISSTLQISSANSLAINGPGTNLLTVSGNNSVQVFAVNAGAVATISGLTIANGRATGYANGAGINNAGSLTLSNCVMINNQDFAGWGGAIFNSGPLTLANSTLSGNQATGENGSGMSNDTAGGGGGAGMGGGLFNMAGSVTITGCTFISNSVTGGFGGAASVNTGNGCGGGPYRTCGCGGNAGLGSGGAGAVANNCSGRNGGLGGGGGGGAGYYAPQGSGGFGGGSGGYPGNYYSGGGGGAGMGGGIFINDGSVSIANCSFVSNQGTGQGGGSGIGAGIFVNTGLVTIVTCSFGGNQATGGNPTGADFFNLNGTIMPTLTGSSLGGGTVTVQPASPPYLSNSWATITATAASGWTFLNWLGDASGTNVSVNVTVTRNKFVQPVFGTPLNVSAFVSVDPQSDYYPYGTPVKLTALPPNGLYFSGWIGSANGTNNPLTIIVTNPNQNVSILFGGLDAGQSALTVIEDGRGHVSVTPYANSHATGQTVTLTPMPDYGQNFIGWTGDASGSSNPLVVTMNQSKTITAAFTKKPSLQVGTTLEGLVDDGFRLTLLGEFGVPYSIMASTNLSQWITAGTVTNTYGTVQFTDTAATNHPYTFYRAMAN